MPNHSNRRPEIEQVSAACAQAFQEYELRNSELYRAVLEIKASPTVSALDELRSLEALVEGARERWAEQRKKLTEAIGRGTARRAASASPGDGPATGSV